MRPAGANAGKHAPLTLQEIAGLPARPAGRSSATRAINAQGAAPSFATHIADVEVDPETGKVKVVRYTAIQDAGRAIHPSYVEGQMQGGVAQGIGWALNEEYIYDDDGRLQNAGFLDYRMPRALRPADDRHGDRRGAEPAPSLRRARRGRDADRARRWPPWPTPSPTRPACASPTCRCRRRGCCSAGRRAGEGKGENLGGVQESRGSARSVAARDGGEQRGKRLRSCCWCLRWRWPWRRAACGFPGWP